MKLTGRQQIFLSEFIQLHQKVKQPMHYTEVAEALGVSKITAYDMLRLLLKQELVQSEYILKGKGTNAGRSTVLFTPTDKAIELFSSMDDEEVQIEAWEKETRQTLIDIGSTENLREYLLRLIEKLPASQTSLIYASNMITALLLGLVLLNRRSKDATLRIKIEAVGFPQPIFLNSLGGFAMGITYIEDIDRRFIEQILFHAIRYQKLLTSFSKEHKILLTN
jgi:predicted transcriptional regulator